jgi:hypothetical protein
MRGINGRSSEPGFVAAAFQLPVADEIPRVAGRPFEGQIGFAIDLS